MKWNRIWLLIAITFVFESAFGAINPKALTRAPRSSLIVDFGRDVPFGVAMVKQEFNRKPAYSMSLFLDSKPYRTLPVPREIFENFASRFGEIYNRNTRAQTPGPCGQLYSVEVQWAKHRPTKNRLCFDELGRADKKAMSRWYADVRRLF